jgi:integrase/recombinase XerD
MSWATLQADYQNELQSRGFTARSLESYTGGLRAFLDFVEAQGLRLPQELSLPVLERYQAFLYDRRNRTGQRLTLGTQAQRLAVVRSFCAFLYRRGLILADPARNLVMPRIERRLPAVILSRREVLNFLKRIRTNDPLGVRDRAIFETFYSTGMRATELAQLTPADLDLIEGFVRIRKGKGNKARVVPLGVIAAQWIQRYLDTARPPLGPERPLFLSPTGHRLSRTALAERARYWAHQAGLDKHVTCHTFRHTCATHMLQARASLRHIQELLGHADPNSTQIYTHVALVDLKRIHQRCHPRNKA